MSEAPPTDPLRLSDCPACGYSLQGLAPQGTCPECGRPYDQAVIVLHGFGTGDRADLSTARPWVAVAIATFYGVLLLKWVRDGVRDPRGDAVGLVLAAAGFVWIGLALWKRWNADLPGLVQVWLSPSGCCQIDNPTPEKQNAATLTPWRDVSTIRVKDAGDGLVQLKLICKSSWWRSDVVPVDAEVRCTPEQAAALRERVDAWRAKVSAGPAPAKVEAAP